MFKCFMCVSGYVYVDLHSEEEVQKALKKNKDYIGEKYYVSFSFLSYSFLVHVTGNERL